MQIDIRILPFFEKPFEKEFPKITGLLKGASYEKALEEEASLYVLLDSLVSLSRDPMFSSTVKERMLPYVDRMQRVKRVARECLISRKLNELDGFLYQIEDLFGDLENNL
jgi:hypothetical protein